MDHDFWSFSFDYPLAMALAFVPALINIYIFFYISGNFAKNNTNVIFSAFALSLGLWQFMEGLVHISGTAGLALQFYRMSGIAALAVASLQLLFALNFTGWSKKIHQSLFILFLLLPTMILIMLMVGGLDQYTMTHSDLWNWIASPLETPTTIVIYLWMSVTSIITLLILWICFFSSKKGEIRRIQSLLLAIGFSIPIVLGIIFEVVSPLLFKTKDFPVTTSLVTSFSIMFLIAIKKYGLLDYSPRYQWEKIMRSMNEGLSIVDKEERFVYANPRFCEMTGYSFEELKGRYAQELLADDESRNKMVAVFDLRKKNISNQNQFLFRRKDGKHIWLTISGFPYLDRKGNVVGAVGVSSDISELMETQIKLNDKISELNMFFYKTSHDFKTPIASIEGLLECYGSDDNMDEFVHYIKLCTKNLALIVDRVSQLSIIQQKNISMETIDVREKIESILSEVEKVTPFKKDIQVFIETDESTIITERFLFRLILMNLIENAVKYRNEKNQSPYIRISVKKKENLYELVVSDNGEGIEAGMQSKVFEMFYRGNDKSKGAGLGLYVVRSAVEKLKGTVRIESEPGISTTFTILLPVVKLN